VESVVALLPAEPAGPGHPITVPVDTVHRFLADDGHDADQRADGPADRPADRWVDDPDDPAWLDEDPLAASGLPASDTGLLLRLAEGRLRGGRFGVNVADPASGRLRRGIPVVSWFDTA
jgi:hypothetical protein